MCGLVGVVSKFLTEPHKKAFYDMLHFDVVRGDDSTGVAIISKPFEEGTEVEVLKNVGGPSEFFYQYGKSKRDKSLTNKSVGIFIGHNRFATQGEVNEDNAHPFEFDNLVGAHNGTVQDYSIRDFHGYKDFDVDSQVIYSHLSHTRSIDDVWEKADGALALVWWDKVDKKLNIIRNSQRPLHIVYSEDDKTVFWASELWMILVACMRQGIKTKEAIEVKPNRLYTFDMAADNKVHHVERDLPPFVEKRAVVYYGSRVGSYANYYDDWDDYRGRTQRKDEPVLLCIDEFHDNRDRPFAVARTEGGSTVKIHIVKDAYQDAKNKILGRKNSKGYYTVQSSRLFDAQTRDFDWWTAWPNLSYVSLKRGDIIRQADGGFTVEVPKAPPPSAEYAPYIKGVLLTQKSWETQVSCGCFNCLNVPNWGCKNEIVWLDKNNFLCTDCKDLTIFDNLKESA